VYDEEGNLLDEKPINANELEKRKKIAALRNKIEDLFKEQRLHMKAWISWFQVS
jgi:hypothetical protein